MTRGKRILVLTPQFPYPPNQGTTIRNYNLIAGLARRHEVHLLSFGDPDVCAGSPLHEQCSSIRVVPTPRRTMRQRLSGLLFSRLPDMAQRLPSAEYSEAVSSALQETKPDVLEVEGIELARYLLEAAAARTGDAAQRVPLLVFDDHNTEYVLQQRAFETDLRSRNPRGWIGAAYSFVQWRRLRRHERHVCLTADRVVSVSDVDAQALRELVLGLEPVVVPNGVDVAFYTQPTAPLSAVLGAAGEDLGRPGLVFTGKMDFRPNVDAVLWFVQEVLPLIRLDVPDALFWVVGKDPHRRLTALAGHPAVRLTGRVEDVRPYIASAAVYVVPLRIGGGTRLKVLEAMAMGKALVSTSLGCEGFDLMPGRDLLVADTPTDFAAAVVGLLGEPHRRERLGSSAFRFAAALYDWSAIVPKLEAMYVNA